MRGLLLLVAARAAEASSEARSQLTYERSRADSLTSKLTATQQRAESSEQRSLRLEQLARAAEQRITAQRDLAQKARALAAEERDQWRTYGVVSCGGVAGITGGQSLLFAKSTMELIKAAARGGDEARVERGAVGGVLGALHDLGERQTHEIWLGAVSYARSFKVKYESIKVALRIQLEAYAPPWRRRR